MNAPHADPPASGHPAHGNRAAGPIYLDYNATTPVDRRVAEVADAALREPGTTRRAPTPTAPGRTTRALRAA